MLRWVLCVQVLDWMLTKGFGLRLLSVRVLGRVLVRLIWVVALVALVVLEALALLAALVLPWVIVMIVRRHICDLCDFLKVLGLCSEGVVVELGYSWG